MIIIHYRVYVGKQRLKGDLTLTMTDKTFVITTDEKEYSEMVEYINREVINLLKDAYRARERFLLRDPLSDDDINFRDIRFVLCDALYEYADHYYKLAADIFE